MITKISIPLSALCILALFVSEASAQEVPAGRISGRVLDASTNTPLFGAHVFYEGTTIGDACDIDGSFSLPEPTLEAMNLVISMVGFEVQNIRMEKGSDYSDDMEIYLEPVIIELDEVVVESESFEEWMRTLSRFRELIFSTTDLGKECTIDNPQVLTLNYERGTNLVTASAQDPIRFTNPGLGYQITVHGMSFRGNERAYEFTGEIQFTTMAPASERQRERWEKNRRKAYVGSMRHFLVALAANDLKEQGFEAYHVASAGEVNTKLPIAEMGIRSIGDSSIGGILTPAGSPDTRWLQFNDVVFVRYRKEKKSIDYIRYLSKYAPSSRLGEITSSGRNQESWFQLPQGYALIDDAGHIFPGLEGYPVAHFGYWGWERFGEMLPDDYEPEDRKPIDSIPQ